MDRIVITIRDADEEKALNAGQIGFAEAQLEAMAEHLNHRAIFQRVYGADPGYFAEAQIGFIGADDDGLFLTVENLTPFPMTIRAESGPMPPAFVQPEAQLPFEPAEQDRFYVESGDWAGFARMVVEAYGGACAFTLGPNAEAMLIRPLERGGRLELANALAALPDIAAAFAEGDIGVAEDGTVLVALTPSGRALPARLVERLAEPLPRAALRWHRQAVFAREPA